MNYYSISIVQSGVGEDVGTSQSCVSRNFWFVCDRIFEKANEFIQFPSNNDEFIRAKNEWSTKYIFPNAIGALDCTLIEIMKPSSFGDEFVCRKGYAALNVQMTCDAKEMITSVDASWAGSVHDSRIWRNSNISTALNENQIGAIMLADEGYGLTPNLMKIYSNPSNPSEVLFNNILKKERVIIERVFGQLKRRFPILGNRVRVATRNIPKLIVACCVLHNIAKILNDPDFEENSNEEDANEVFVYESSRSTGSVLERGKIKRIAIANYLFQNYNE